MQSAGGQALNQSRAVPDLAAVVDESNLLITLQTVQG